MGKSAFLSGKRINLSVGLPPLLLHSTRPRPLGRATRPAGHYTATGQAGHYLRSRSRARLTRALTLAAGKSRVLVPGHRAVNGPPPPTGQAGHRTGPPGRLQTIIQSAVTVPGLTHRSTDTCHCASAGSTSPSQIDFTLGCWLARGPEIRADDHGVQAAGCCGPGLGPWAAGNRQGYSKLLCIKKGY